ncbi:orotate phosphoribosyltransferase [Buchnera aphidicola]|uniref:Orotate phosphoribosyltransferase n=1 Tax=Buchnera aphidicola (Aphis nerii) TaxID=1241835 RepID=A0A4D6XX29_9GAMM|nr:orotate phosphoribosyltransferase [Buchnera aphidicola]QCI19068.1 orotate phosphoribosyltransferase [Buchnera aphidicola (Aphis nerii)]
MEWKKEFIDFLFKKKVLKFGKFILKSGRISPYFFNSGLLSTGKDTVKIGMFYARAIMDLNIKFDMLFGPAYKGIPIVVSTSIALKNQYNLDIPYSFNRKEEKKYGEGGQLIGGDIKNKKIIILDDVITSGISINHSVKIIEKENSKISSIFVLLDRKEKKETNLYKINHSNNQKNYKINSIITINDLFFYLSKKEKLRKYANKLVEYHKKYGSF